MDPSYTKSGVGIPMPLLQRVDAPQTNISETKEVLAQKGQMLLRLVDGSLSAFGPNTHASKEAIEVDHADVAAKSITRYYEGPVQGATHARKKQ